MDQARRQLRQSSFSIFYIICMIFIFLGPHDRHGCKHLHLVRCLDKFAPTLPVPSFPTSFVMIHTVKARLLGVATFSWRGVLIDSVIDSDRVSHALSRPPGWSKRAMPQLLTVFQQPVVAPRRLFYPIYLFAYPIPSHPILS